MTERQDISLRDKHTSHHHMLCHRARKPTFWVRWGATVAFRLPPTKSFTCMASQRGKVLSLKHLIFSIYLFLFCTQKISHFCRYQVEQCMHLFLDSEWVKLPCSMKSSFDCLRHASFWSGTERAADSILFTFPFSYSVLFQRESKGKGREGKRGNRKKKKKECVSMPRCWGLF